MKVLDVRTDYFSPVFGRRCNSIRRLDPSGGPKEAVFFEHKVLIEAVVQHDFSAVPLLEKYWGPLAVLISERLRDTDLSGDTNG